MTLTLSINDSQRLQLSPLGNTNPPTTRASPQMCILPLQAMNTSPVGHLDPAFKLMDEIQSLLRYVWQTENLANYCCQWYSTAAMEGAIANITEPMMSF